MTDRRSAIRTVIAATTALPFALTTAGRAAPAPRKAVPTSTFLDSVGVATTWPNRGQPISKTIEMVNSCGFRWVRAGLEGLTAEGAASIKPFLDLHKFTGVKLNWGLVSGGTDVDLLIRTARILAEAGALLAIEGNNEPNNWGVDYKGEKGGGKDQSWLPVAKLHRDLYQAVKSDPVLARYPVWSLSEPGAQLDNTGLQFLQIPPGAKTMMPDGTRYADYANVHNYIYHPRSPKPMDNKVWNAADPSVDCMVDGLFGNFGITWRRKFKGYAQRDLDTLPRVTTETGTAIDGPITEDVQAVNLLNLYLAQFARGYSYTAVYILRDRTDEAGNQTYGFFRPNYTPRKAAIYLRNLTTILADKGRTTSPASLAYEIPKQPETVHDLLLQRSDGAFQLVVWGERLSGEDRVTVRLSTPQASITIHDPTKGVTPVRRLRNVASIDLALSDHPLVLTMAQPRAPLRKRR